jgi:general secretion pathway protein G
MSINRYARKGFTLVEILIVVIILGILAAIVIPQFTNASEDARQSSVRSSLQTLRSQIELYKLQHLDQYPLDDQEAWDWTKMTGKTDETGAAGGVFGPYMQQPSQNSLRPGKIGVQVVADDAAALSAEAGENDAFVFSQATGKLWAFEREGGILAD